MAHLAIIADSTVMAIVDDEFLNEAFADWQRTAPRSLKEIARWDAVIEKAQDIVDADIIDVNTGDIVVTDVKQVELLTKEQVASYLATR